MHPPIKENKSGIFSQRSMFQSLYKYGQNGLAREWNSETSRGGYSVPGWSFFLLCVGGWCQGRVSPFTAVGMTSKAGMWHITGEGHKSEGEHMGERVVHAGPGLVHVQRSVDPS